jgi:hypothetical protein
LLMPHFRESCCRFLASSPSSRRSRDVSALVAALQRLLRHVQRPDSACVAFRHVENNGRSVTVPHPTVLDWQGDAWCAVDASAGRRSGRAHRYDCSQWCW